MRRVLITLFFIAGTALMAAPAVADEATPGSESQATSDPTPAGDPSPTPTDDSSSTPTDDPSPTPTEAPGEGGPTAGEGGSTPGEGGSAPGGGGSSPGGGGSNSAADGLPPGPPGLPPGTGSTTETGIPPVSITAIDAAAVDIGILADTPVVRFCHATNSDENPYNDPSSATAGVANGHDKEHNGPIWNPTLKDQHIKWGDVIEPYTYNGVDYPGQNWDEGFYNAGCNPSSDTILVSAEPPTATDPTCEAAGELILPVTEGVSYSSDPGGTGPGTYTVTATAESGYEINGPTEFEITVLPQRSGDQCIEHPGDSTDVKFCHRTNSNSNPYNNPESATAGVANGHDEQHEGPIWDPTLKDLGIEWGDIIEPYTFNGVDYPGQNWAEGEAIYNAGCIFPDIPPGEDDDDDGDDDGDGDGDGDGDDDGDDKEAALPDTGGPSQWTLLMGVLLTLLGVAILSNRESLVRNGVFQLVQVDAPKEPASVTIGRHAADLPATVVTPGSRLERLTGLGAAVLVAVAIFGNRPSK